MLFRNFTTSASVTAKSATRSLGSSTAALSTFYLKSLALFIVGMAFFVGRGEAQILWSTSTTGGAWLSTGNWTGGAVPTTTGYAQFQVNPTSTGQVGINLNGSTNNGANNQAVGAIEVTGSRTVPLILGNSSTTANGTFTFNGTTVNSVANTILRNNTSQLFTIQDNTAGGTRTMGVALGNATNNIISIEGAGGITISSIISGANKLTKFGTGSGAFILSGANTYSGVTTINEGTLTLGAAAPSGSAGTLGNATSDVLLGNTSGTANASLLTNGAFTIARPITIQTGNTGTISLGGSNTSGTSSYTGNILLNKSVSLVTGSAGTTSFGTGVISGTGGVTINATGGTINLSGTNTYSGATTVTAGTLSIASIANGGTNSNIGASTNAAANLVLGGGTLSYTGATTSTDRNFTLNASTTSTINLTNNLTISGASTATNGALTKTGTGTLILSGSNLHTGATTISAGTLQIGDGGTTGSISTSSTIANTAALIFNRSDNYGQTYSQIISGAAGTLTVNGGTLTLSGTNTYTGATTINAGTLTLNAAAPSGSAGTLGNASSAVLLGNTSGSSNASLLANGTFTVARPITIQAGNTGSITLGGSNTTGTSTFTGAIAANKAVTLVTGSGGTTLFGTGIFSGAGAITVNATGGTINLTGANTFTGGLNLSAGTLSLGNATALGGVASTFAIAGNTTLDASATTSISAANPININGSFAFTGTSTLNLGTGLTTLSTSPTITCNSATNALTLGGKITGAFGITKAGVGLLTLSGAASDYTGGVTLSNGTLNINSTTALGATAGTLSIAAATTINNTSGGVITNANNNPISIAGNLTFTGTNDLNLGTGAVTIANSTSPTITTTTSAKTLTLGGVVSGTGLSITKSGAGNLTLSGNNTFTGSLTATQGTLTLSGSNAYTGATLVNGGSLNLSKSGGSTISSSSSVTITSGTLTINSDQTISNLTLGTTGTGGTGILSVPAGVTLTVNNFIYYGGFIDIAGTLVLSGNYNAAGIVGTNIFTNRGTVKFTGSSTITFPGGNVTNPLYLRDNAVTTNGYFKNVEISKTSSTNVVNISTASTGLIISGTLTLTNGIFNATGSNPITLVYGSTLSCAFDGTSYVSGTLSLPVSTTATVTYPVGYVNYPTNTIFRYRPFTYQSPSGNPAYLVSITPSGSAWSRTPSNVSTSRFGTMYYSVQHASTSSSLSLNYNVGISTNGNTASGTPVIINANATSTTNATINSNTFLTTANSGYYTTTGGGIGTYLTNNPAYWLTYNGLYYYLDTVALVEKAIPLSVTGASVANKQYDGNTSAVVSGGTLVGVQGTDVVNLVTSTAGTFASANVGTGIAVTSNFSITGANASAYTLNQPTLSANITQATSTVSVNNSGPTYNGFQQAATFTTFPVAGTVSNVLYNGSATVPTNAGSYTVTVDFTPTDATNYTTLTGALAGSFVINQITPTISVNNSPVTYTGIAQSATFNTSTTGTISNIQYNGGSTAVNAANYPVTVTFTPSNANYATLTGVFAGYFLINPTVLTITAGNQIVPYSTATSVVTDAGSYTPTGFVGGETAAVISGSVAYTTTYTASTAVGASGITITPDVTGLSATNYSFTPVNGSVSVICNTNTWTGATSSVWNLGSNWCSGTAPTSGADIILPTGTTNQPSLAANTEIGNIDIASGAILDLGGYELTINGSITGSGLLKGSTTSSLVIAGAAGTINFAGANNTIKDLTLNGSSSATLGAALNITAGSAPGSVTVGASGTLTTGGFLTLKSDASGTAKVANSAGSISGDVTVERYIPSKAARYFSFLASPVTQTVFNGWQQQMYVTGTGTGGQNCGSTSSNGGTTDKYNSNWFDKTTTNSPSMHTYNATAVSGSRWVSIANTNATNLAPGKGFRVNVRGDRNLGTCTNQLNSSSPTAPTAVTLKATGTVGQGNTSVTLNSISSTLLSLVGNPYPSPIDFATLQLANSGSLYPNMWTLSPSSSGNYTTYNNGVTSGAPSGYSDGLGNTSFIASGQAFFVQSKSAANGGTGSLNFTEGTKTTGVIPNTSFFGTSNNQLFRITLANAINSKLDEAVVRFNNKGTNAYDANWDALSLSTANQTLATMKAATKLAIATHPANLATDTVQLSLTSTTVDSLQLVFSDYQGIDSAASIVLRDKFLGVAHDVRANQVYNFTVTNDAASKGNSRFEVVFTKGGTTLPVNFTAISAVKKEGGIAVNWKVAQPINITKYNVERSIDRVNFTSIATVNATSVTDYTITDNQLPNANVVYYRIQSEEQNGTKAYSSIAQVSLNSKAEIASIYPNPVKEVMNVTINGTENASYTLRILNLAGKEVANTNRAKIVTKQFSMNVSTLAGGIYMVEFTNAKGEKSLVKMIKE